MALPSSYKVVDRFQSFIASARSVGAPGSTANITLQSTEGLDTTGRNVLTVFRRLSSGVEMWVDTIYDWSGISATTLTGAKREYGVALRKGDVVYCVPVKRQFDRIDEIFDEVAEATDGTLTNPTITGGTIDDAAIAGGTLDGAAITGSTVGTTAITGGTISGAAVTGGTISGSAISGGTVASAAISSPTISGTWAFASATVTGLPAGGFDIVATTAAELIAAMVSGNAGKSIWVKSGTYTVTTQDIRIYSGMHVLWGGGGGDGTVTIDFGDTAYTLVSCDDWRYATLNGTSGATGTITGSVAYDGDVGSSSAALPNEAGWRVSACGIVGDYTYASANTYTSSPYPLSNVVATSNGYHALITKGAAEKVVMRGHLILKGTSGVGIGTQALSAKLIGHGWDCSGLKLDLRKRGYRPVYHSSSALIFLTSSQLGTVCFDADHVFTNTSNDFSAGACCLQLLGQDMTIDNLIFRNIKLVNNSSYNGLFRLMFDAGSHVLIKNLQAHGLEIGKTSGSSTNTMVGFVSLNPRVGVVIANGRGSAWRKESGTAMTTGSDSGAITSQFSTTNGCSLGSWIYTP